MVLAVELIATLSTLTLALLTFSISEIRAVERYQNREIAFHLAEGAVDQTIASLRADPSYAGIATTTNSLGSYSSTVCSAIVPSNCTDPMSPPVSGKAIINAAGNTGSGASLAQTRTISVVIEIIEAKSFNFASFGGSSLEIRNNALIDSYDASSAAYDPLTAFGNGDVATNSTTATTLELKNSAQVKGDVYAGFGGIPGTVIVITGGASVTGTQDSLAAAEDVSAVSAPASLSNSGVLSLSGSSTQTLSGGSYMFDSITLSDSAQLTFTGSAIVYVNGNVTLNSSAGIVTKDDFPGNLQIYVIGANAILIQNSTQFYGAIYAPGSNLTLQDTAQVYGAVKADVTLIEEDAQIHYDEALADPTNSRNEVRILAWVEGGSIT